MPPLPPQPGNEQPPGFFPVDPVTQAGEATQRPVPDHVRDRRHRLLPRRRAAPLHHAPLPSAPATDRAAHQTHGSNLLEILWTIVPAITVTVLFVAALITLNEEYDARPRRLRPRRRRDRLPVAMDVRLRAAGPLLHRRRQPGPRDGPADQRDGAHPAPRPGQDVIHSFYVPQFLYKLDVVPGRVNEFDVVVTKPGMLRRPMRRVLRHRATPRCTSPSMQ